MLRIKMAPRKKGGLQTVQKETDELERKVNALVQYVNTLGVSERATTSRRCSDLQSAVTAMLTTLQKLTKADERAPVGDYDQRKRQEEERLRTLQEKLRDLTVQPQDISAEDEDENEDEDSQEEHADVAQDDDDGDEGDDRKSSQKSDVCYVVLSSFRGQEEGDLIVKKGAVVKILEKSDDGWWFAQDKEGNKGLVPKTYLKKMSPNERVAEMKEEKDDDDDDDDDDDEDDGDDGDEVQEGENDPADRKPSTASNWDTVRQAVSETIGCLVQRKDGYRVNRPVSATTTTVQIHFMGRNTQLSREKRKSIITLRNEGQSIRKISRTLNVSPSAVAKTIKRYDETGSYEDRPRKGRPRATSAAEDKFIQMNSPRNGGFTAPQIRAHINASRSSSGRHISTSTVQRRLRESCNLAPTLIQSESSFDGLG